MIKFTSLPALALAAALCLGSNVVQAQSKESQASAMSVGSVVYATSAVSAASVGAVLAVPAALSVGGAQLGVKAVESTAKGTVYVLERVSDGAKVSVEVLSRGATAASAAVGSMVLCSVIGAGVVLSVAGEALAFIPNAVGRTLLSHERVQ